ncbi:MAG: hypothetical protein JW727_04830 [Candidatus Aenigmarchaeota archaeon]|nr:hypothetical protein [Candidatus Aenigmarchaeota archaeon]
MGALVKRAACRKKPAKNSEKFVEVDSEKFVRLAQEKYDGQVTILLRFIEEAEREGNREKLQISKSIAESWIKYFEALKSGAKDMAGKDREGISVVNSFIDEQVHFFRILSGEIDKKLHDLSTGRFRAVLE